jgi:L-ascorbate metabolism protein UlaG (beta-lactamase superfamily)
MKHTYRFAFAVLMTTMLLSLSLTGQVKRIGRDVKVTWYGHAAFKIESPKGKIILIDPWLDNPKAPSSARSIDRVDLILVTHGHADHIGNTVDLAQKFDATVVCNGELAEYFKIKGVKKTVVLDYSGTYVVDNIKIIMVHADHGSSIDNNGQRMNGGEACGFVVQCENGATLYHAGDTGVFGDMKLIAELYKPDVIMIPIGGMYTMGPKEAAKACELLNPKCIIPMHYDTFPALTGSPVELKNLLPGPLKNKVVDILPGDTVN